MNDIIGAGRASQACKYRHWNMQRSPSGKARISGSAHRTPGLLGATRMRPALRMQLFLMDVAFKPPFLGPSEAR